MLNTQYIAIARQLSEGPHASFLNDVMESFIQKWAKEPMVKDTEYGTLVCAIEFEAKKKAFRILKDEIDNIAMKND